MMERANAVIDYYLNGPGSYWDAGPRKPLIGVGEEGDSTVNDLKNFRNNVFASKQYVNDPDFVIDSIIALIDQTTKQVEDAAQNNEVNDDILRDLRPDNDLSLPISFKAEPRVSQFGGGHGIPRRERIRILSRRIVN